MGRGKRWNPSCSKAAKNGNGKRRKRETVGNTYLNIKTIQEEKAGYGRWSSKTVEQPRKETLGESLRLNET